MRRITPRDTPGPTATSQFRLGAETLASLDAIAVAYSTRDGRPATRTAVLRELIAREAERLAGKNSGKTGPDH